MSYRVELAGKPFDLDPTDRKSIATFAIVSHISMQIAKAEGKSLIEYGAYLEAEIKKIAASLSPAEEQYFLQTYDDELNAINNQFEADHAGQAAIQQKPRRSLNDPKNPVGWALAIIAIIAFVTFLNFIKGH